MTRFLLYPTNQHAVPLAILIRVRTNKTTRFTPLETKSIYNGKDGIQSKRNVKLYTNSANISNGDQEEALRAYFVSRVIVYFK